MNDSKFIEAASPVSLVCFCFSDLERDQIIWKGNGSSVKIQILQILLWTYLSCHFYKGMWSYIYKHMATEEGTFTCIPQRNEAW